MSEVREGYKMTELGEIPDDWSVKKLRDILTIGYGKNQKEVEVKSSDIPILGTGGIIGFSSKSLFDKPSVLIGRKGTIDKPRFIDKPFWTIDTLFYTDIYTDKANPKFVYYLFNSIDWYLYNEATGVPSLSAKNISSIKFAYMPLEEQQKIADILSTVDTQIERTEQMIEQTKELKHGLMQQLLTKGIGNKKFKDSIIGNVPDSWKVKLFFDNIDKIFDYRGRTPKKLNMNWGNGEIKALSANNVKMGYIDFNAECNYGSEELYNRWMTKGDLKKDDILFTMEAPLGQVTLVPDNRKYILSQRVVAFRTNDQLSPHFFMQYLSSNIFQDQLMNYATGTTAKGISQRNLARLIVAIPPLEEQQKIAEILSSVDDQIDIYEKEKEKYEELKKGLMQQLLTGKIRVKVDE